MSLARMKKNILSVVLLLLMILFTGCGGRSEEALKNEQAYRQLGINKMQEGDFPGAVEAFQKALDQSLAIVDELEVDICYYKAEAQIKSGDTKGAIETYSALLDYDDENSDAYYLRGCQYLRQEDTKLAQQDFKQAMALNKKNPQMYNQIAISLKTAGLEEEAGKVLGQALELKGDGVDKDREKGYTYYLLGEYDNARQYLDKAVGKEDTKAVLYLASVYEAQGDTKQAQKMYETYVSKNEEDTKTINALGCMKLAEGDYQQALTFFQMALQVENPINKQELLRNEIAALEYTKDFVAAKEKMGEYLAAYPKDEAAQRENEFLQTR